MTNTIAIVQARVGSTRHPGKTLMNIMANRCYAKSLKGDKIVR